MNRYRMYREHRPRQFADDLHVSEIYGMMCVAQVILFRLVTRSISSRCSRAPAHTFASRWAHASRAWSHAHSSELLACRSSSDLHLRNTNQFGDSKKKRLDPQVA